jgi:MFS family permease
VNRSPAFRHARYRIARWAAASAPGGLWRHPEFRSLWAGQTVSAFGSEITTVALPLTAAVTLQATPGQMGVLRAAEFLPPVLVGLVAGVWVDRLRRRPVLLGANVAAALVLLTVPVAAARGLLRVELLYAVATAGGVLGVLFRTAYAAYLPSVVPAPALVEANGKLAVTSSVAYIAGPGVAGPLVQVLTAPGAMALDGLSFFASALGIARIRTPEPPPPPPAQRRSVPAEMGEGLRLVARTPVLRAVLASSATLDLFWNGIMAVYVLFLTRDLGLLPAAFGLIVAAGSVGGLAGAAVAPRVTRRLGLGRTLVGAQLLLGAGGLLLGLAVLWPAAALPLLVASQAVQLGMNAIYGVNRVSLEQAVTPARLRGRVRGSGAVVGAGAVAAGTLLGGLLGDRIGLGPTILVGVAGGLFAFLWLWWSPIRRLRELPSEHDPDRLLPPR